MSLQQIITFIEIITTSLIEPLYNCTIVAHAQKQYVFKIIHALKFYTLVNLGLYALHSIKPKVKFYI